MVLSEAGLIKQTLQVFVDHLRPMLEKEYNVMDAFIPYLQSLIDDPNLVCGHALHMAVALLSMHLQGCEVGLLEPRHEVCTKLYCPAPVMHSVDAR